jgi:hypothetical protein
MVAGQKDKARLEKMKKKFFSEEKNQKTFAPSRASRPRKILQGRDPRQGTKVFLLRAGRAPSFSSEKEVSS